MDNDQSAEAEFGNAPLGNRLRSIRLVKCSSLFASEGPSPRTLPLIRRPLKAIIA